MSVSLDESTQEPPGNGVSPLRSRLSAQEHCELQLLACMQAVEYVYSLVANDLGVRVDEFSSARGRKLYREIDAYHAEHGRVPSSVEILAFGAGIDRLDVELLESLAGGETDMIAIDPMRVRERVSELRRLNADSIRKLRVAEAQSALASGRADVARAIIDEIKTGPAPLVHVYSTAEIFAPLEDSAWKVRGLHLGPGRPAMIAGYGASAKTLAAQALGLSLACGACVWGFFECFDRGRVLHLDYEQGFAATRRRYQRLAIGHDLPQGAVGERLTLACLPRLFLDAPGADAEYARLCEGQDLVILDSLKAASPTRDENDSQVRTCLDVLTRVSEKTGCAFLVLHHAGKPKEGHADTRTLARGSSAIFDACGCVLTLSVGKKATDGRKVQQVKQPAEAAGGPIEPFELVVEDVPIDTNPTAGVRVLHRVPEESSVGNDADRAFDRDAEQMLSLIARHPGESGGALTARAGINRARGFAVLVHLEESGKVHHTTGRHNVRGYHLGTQE